MRLRRELAEAKMDNVFLPKATLDSYRQGNVDEHTFAVICHFDKEGTHTPRYSVTMMARPQRRKPSTKTPALALRVEKAPKPELSFIYSTRIS